MGEVVELLDAPTGLYRAAALGLIRRGRPASLPETVVVRRQVSTDLDALAGYARVCGYRLAPQLPPTWPHVLAFPLALTLMAGNDFPFPVVGVVHVANRITVRRPIPVGTPLDLEVTAADLRPDERGQAFDVVATATVDGEEVWHGLSTYLRRASAGGARPPREPVAPPAATAKWRVERSVGPAYAAVSGDHNPIHTSRLGARAFGFKRPIAHGMWSKARCLAALEGRLPDAYTVDVAFKLPILLPATVAFAAHGTSDPGWDFWLHDARSGRPHLAGTVRP